METADLLKKVRKIEIKTRGLSKHLFSGAYHSVFKGRGMSFSEVRDYTYGDDVRNIDWNVTARTGSPHVKVFEEERELTLMLVVDVSASSRFGTVQALKSELFAEIAAVLSFSAIQNNDKVGMILFSDRVEKYIPPKKGRQHILLIIRQLLQFEPEGKGTDISKALEYFTNVQKKRTICFVMSDFIDRDYGDSMRIAARRHDLIALDVRDPFERNMDAKGIHRIQDGETGQEILVDLSSQKHREELKKYFESFESYLKPSCLKSGVDLLRIEMDQPYVNALLKFFDQRKGS